MNRAEKRRQLKLAKKAARNTQGEKSTNPSIQQTLNLAKQHHAGGQLPRAENLYNQILQADPDHHEAMYLLGVIAQQVGKNDVAVALISKSLAINPLNDKAHNNLGLALQALGKTTEAIECFHKSIAANPLFIEAHGNLGNAYQGLGQSDKAIASHLKALAIKPNFAEAQNNLGGAYMDMGKMEPAIARFRQALSIQPGFDVAHSNLIMAQDFIETIDQAEQQSERKAFNDKFIAPLANNIIPHTNDTNPERRLRIGYVSADFYLHSAHRGFAPLIMDFDRHNFEVICYDSTARSDQISQALMAAATQWRCVQGLSDEALAQTIRADAIDILVDLSGHTLGNRLKTFGYKPAPLQVTGIGHSAPGVSTIDYRLTTLQRTPPEEQDIYPEQPIYLNASCAYTPPPGTPLVGPSPYLENGFITFGFLGRYGKCSDAALALWGKILLDVPGSRLLLKYAQLDDPAAGQNIRQFFAALGIDEERLILLGKTEQHAHLEAHNRVDIVFDTFPHGGGITTMDSLWMGVPVIGLSYGHKEGGRILESICHPLGLGDLATGSTDQYHAIAVDWAARTEHLSALRQQLRARFNGVFSQFHKNVEKSYRLIWRRWCAGQPATPLYP